MGRKPSVAIIGTGFAGLGMAIELKQAGTGAVLAGSLPGSGTGSAIDAVTSGAAGVKLSTVDNANRPAGQIFVVLALRLLLDPHASPSAFGVVPNAVPSPIPTTPPTASPSPSSSSTTRPHKAKS